MAESKILKSIEEMIRNTVREELSTGGVIKEFSNAKDCSDRFSVPSNQLREWWREGKIRGKKLKEGRQGGMLYKVSDIREFLLVQDEGEESDGRSVLG